MKKKLVKIEKEVALSADHPEEIKLKRTKIKVVGVGEGGCSIISGIASQISKATFLAANTNKQALKAVGKNVARFQFGENLTRGLGTGMNPEIGEQAALLERDKIRRIFDGQDLCVIVACLGGGTGSGAASVFARVAKSAGCLTYGIFTLPFNFEGEKKNQIAKEALEKLKPRLHAFSVIPNERIFQIISKETPLKKALSAINERLAQSLEGLIEIIYEPGLINIDFADFRTILEGQGRLTYLNTVNVRRKEGAIQEEIEKLLNSPLYPYGIRGAKGVLYNIAGGKSLSLQEVSQISKTISSLVNRDAKIIFGISQNQKYENEIKTTLLATGCGLKIFTNDKPIKPSLSAEPPKKIENAPLVAKKEEQNQAKTPLKAKLLAPEIKKTSETKNKKIRSAKKENSPVKIKRIKKSSKTKPAAVKEQKQKIGKKTETRVRKNAIQLKEEAKQEEEIMLDREKIWETPAFLRRKKIP
jgi:cell division protein FtsZ